MKSYTMAVVAPIMEGSLQGNSHASFRYLATDSRKISFPNDTLFFALTTARRNGHAFVADAYSQGVRMFVVSEPMEQVYDNASFITVDNTLHALQLLAAWHRKQFELPVIGITGSNGKTIVKEWLYEMLQDEENIVRSPKSFNSQIGVPLSVWQLNENASLGIFEAGISQQGEMQHLADIIQPTIGIFTMLGDAHNEGFASPLQKLQEKFLLFENCSHLICHTDDKAVLEQAQIFGGILLDWGKHENAWAQIVSQETSSSFTIIQLLVNEQHIELNIPFGDEASIQNALHAAVYLLHRQFDAQHINDKLKRLRHLDMRLQWKKAIHGCYLLNDSYSNDFTSLLQAFDYLSQQSRNSKQTIILSDLSAPAASETTLYSQLGQLLQSRKISRFIGVGAAMLRNRHVLQQPNLELLLYATTDELLKHFPSIVFNQEDILLKGGRSFELEQIAALLEAQQHQTLLEINLTAMATNLRHYRSLIGPATKMMVMVKAFGYGSGDAEIGRALQFSGVDYLAVAFVDEGVALRQGGVHLPIMVLNTDPAAFDLMEQYNLEPEVYSFEFLQTLLQWCRHKGISNYPVHLKIDTGMHRLGFETKSIEVLGQQLAPQNALVVKSVFTHLVASEDPEEDAFTAQQLEMFDTAGTQLRHALGYSFLQHAANTAAISRHPQAHFDMVRLGVGLYGGSDGLLPVMQLATTVAQVKKVAKGETVGYGRQAQLDRDSIIATVRIGYADGYSRRLGNGVGAMYLKGRLVPVVGRICMDMTMLDVTDIPGVQAGDRVEVFGNHISIQEVAKWCGTIPYEIMTGISQRVKRVYIEET